MKTKRRIVPQGHIRWELLDYKTREPSGLYTCDDCALYKNRRTKKKYVRSEESLRFRGDNPPGMPPAIEFTDPPEDWKKVRHTCISGSDNSMRLVQAYASMQLLKGDK